jgi:hypothetical protein
MLRLLLGNSLLQQTGAHHITAASLKYWCNGPAAHQLSTLVSGRTFESWAECVQDLRSRQLITSDAVAAVMHQLDRASFISQYVSFGNAAQAYTVCYCT